MPQEPIDLRKHASQTRARLVVAGLVLIVVLGILLILLTYGTPAAVCGTALFFGALVPVGLIVLFLGLLQWIVNRSNRDR